MPVPASTRRLWAVALLASVAGASCSAPSLTNDTTTHAGAAVCPPAPRRTLLQAAGAPTHCLYPDDFAPWTIDNCFRGCLQATMGSTLNFYDFSWNYSTALTDLSLLNPSAALQVQLNKNSPMIAACYNEPLPVKALGACLGVVATMHVLHA